MKDSGCENSFRAARQALADRSAGVSSAAGAYPTLSRTSKSSTSPACWRAPWVAELSQARVPAGQVNDIAGAFALAEGLGLEPIVEVSRPDGGVARLTRNPIRLSATPASYRTAPPVLPETAAG